MRTCPVHVSRRSSLVACVASGYLLATWVGAAGAATVRATSCALADVQTAIDSARAGDTVIVPAGICHWGAGLSFGDKGLHVRGETRGATTLVHDAGSSTLFTIREHPQYSVELSQLGFEQGSGGADAWDGMFLSIYFGTSAAAGKPVLVHDNDFSLKTSGRRGMVIRTNRGVIWHNTFNANGQDAQAIAFLGPSDSWQSPDTLGARDVTGTANVYVEDNAFGDFLYQTMDPDSNSRVVIRYNTFDHAGIASHGADTSESGTRHWELYNNTFTFVDRGDCDGSQTVSLNWYFYIRGGTGVIADNQMDDIKSCAWGDKAEILLTVQNIHRKAGPYPCWTSYPVPHQVGQGHNGHQDVSDPIYVWGNSAAARVGIGAYRPDECGNGQSIGDYIQQGRDYVLGPRPGYAKFAYPHPLRHGNTTPPPSPPAAPSNLRVE